jgi:hypothetical protein
VNLKAFFVEALSSALDLGIATADDVLRHVTPDVLASHLPRPLWARLLTACVGAPHVDAALVVETLGVPNLCEHIPAPVIWSCIEELAQRALGGAVISAPTTAASSSRPNAVAVAPVSRPVPLPTPPPPPPAEPKVAAPPAPVAVGPSIPSPLPGTEGDGDPGRSRLAPGQRFRPSNTGIGRLATNSARRPQAQAAPSPPLPAELPVERAIPAPRVKRGQTESDFDLETLVGGRDDWKSSLAVEDEQLVDWSAAEETSTSGDELGRKR